MPAKKKKRATKRPAKQQAQSVTAKYKCRQDIPIPSGDCAKVQLPTDVAQLAAELEAYLSCLCAWQTAVAAAVNTCCGGGGPNVVPPPPKPPF